MRRAFSGLAGSPLARTADTQSQPKPRAKRSTLVLVHFCHDQQSGESKPLRCNCNLRIDRSTAYEHCDAKRADWLRYPNPKTGELILSHKAIVSRRVVVDRQIIFGVEPPEKKGRVCDSVTELTTLRNRVRKIIERCVAKGIFPAIFLNCSKGPLNDLLDDPEALLKILTDQGQNRLHAELIEILEARAVLEANRPKHIASNETAVTPQKLEKIIAAAQRKLGVSEEVQEYFDERGVPKPIGGRRSPGANYVPRRFNKGFFKNQSTGPDSYDRDEE